MSKMDMDTMIRSLNGYEEIAIDKHFDAEILELLDKPVKAGRALLLVQAKRDGMKDAEAYAHVMALTVGEVNDSFEEDEPEVFPDDPETEAGKEPSAPVSELPSSPASASPQESSLPSFSD